MPRSPAKPNPERRRAEQQGRRAENLAALFLQLKGYRIVERRYRTPVGELDLVVRRGKLLVFVEVKVRARPALFGEALAAVNTDRIVRAAKYYLMRNPDAAGLDCRFDVIFLAPRRWPRHVRNAFFDA